MGADAKALTAIAERGERQAATSARQAEEAAAAVESARKRRNEALASGIEGKPIADLAAACDRAERDLASALTLAVAAADGAKAAREKAERATLDAQLAALNAALAAADNGLEKALRGVAGCWTAHEALEEQARPLTAAIAAHERRYKTTLPRPSAGAAELTSDCYALARHAGPELKALDLERERLAHPAPLPPSVRPEFLVAGDSPRAQRQREALRNR